ncbi:phage tail protein [Brevibacillus brevis]|uniref:phage tail protein n=1 Tax=Brevibacillus brevis TaxID=1393 RepID=UPI001C8EEC83|nr:phage tail protein [Brevibacillus brevis]MBY0088115.1 phage tail protein [Brevibacillus brevis]
MIEFTAEQIEKAERLLQHIPGGAQKALSRSMNRAVDSAKTEASRKARETYHIRHKDVLDTIKVSKSSPSDLSAMVLSRGHVLPLTKFITRPNKPQPAKAAALRWNKGRPFNLVVRVKRGEGGSIKKAFVAQMKSGHLGVFHRSNKNRLPLVQRFGPSVPEMLGNIRVTDAVERRATAVMDERLDHEIKRMLEGQT